MSTTNEVIGKRISSARKEAKLTQAELSERIGISEKYLSRIECGKQLPSIIIVAKICNLLNLSADELLTQTDICNNKRIQNKMRNFSEYEQKRILDIIKIIKDIKNHN